MFLEPVAKRLHDTALHLLCYFTTPIMWVAYRHTHGTSDILIRKKGVSSKDPTSKWNSTGSSSKEYCNKNVVALWVKDSWTKTCIIQRALYWPSLSVRLYSSLDFFVLNSYIQLLLILVLGSSGKLSRTRIIRNTPLVKGKAKQNLLERITEGNSERFTHFCIITWVFSSFCV